MAQFTISVPDEFLPLLTAIMQQTGTATQQECVRKIVGNFLVNAQVEKELTPQVQSRTAELVTLWTS